MAMTESEARAKVIAEARRWVGYNPGKTYSKFGEWYGWPSALWCAAFASWCYYEALGTTAAKLVISHESTAPYQRGYIWTVAFRNWLATHGQWVPLSQAKPGDLMFFKYPTSGSRNDNPVNHIDVVEANHYAAGYITTIGGNTPKPGTPGDPSDGRGCWRHYRSIHDRYIVGVYSARWAGLVIEDPVDVILDLTKPIIDALNDCGYDATPAGVKAFQRDCPPLEIDGIAGPKTQARLEIEVTKVLDKLTEVERHAAYTRQVVDQIRQRGRNHDDALVALAEGNAQIKQALADLAAALDLAPEQVAAAVMNSTLDLTDAQMRALVTNQRTWPLRRLLTLSLAHRNGLIFQRSAENRSLLEAILAKVGGDTEQAIAAAAADLAADTKED